MYLLQSLLDIFGHPGAHETAGAKNRDKYAAVFRVGIICHSLEQHIQMGYL
jgi:hypothetical protein